LLGKQKCREDAITFPLSAEPGHGTGAAGAQILIPWLLKHSASQETIFGG